MALIDMLSHSTMVALGKITNPQTGEQEIDLQQAQGSIDLISMLEKRTKGNLSSREKSHLEFQLTNLRMNYLNECSTASKASPSANKSTTEDASTGDKNSESSSKKAASSGDQRSYTDKRSVSND